MNDQPVQHPASMATNGIDAASSSPTCSAHPDTFMTETSLIPTDLALIASEPGIDPCEVAESAMPDLVIGDLAEPDEDWVRRHTLTCSYCANLVHSYEEVCSTLDERDTLVLGNAATLTPPTLTSVGLASLRYGYTTSPVGDILLAVSDEGVADISYLAEHDRYDKLRELETRGFLVYERQEAVTEVTEQLHAYFAHQRQEFDLPVDLTGVTDFTQRVLRSSLQIPYGKVWTYGDIARAIGQPRASRAVGNALGRNPIPVVIPCHRVILASGAMGWYTGGPEIKRTLLGIEGVTWAHETQVPLALET